jgi:hypothetical protein
MGYLYLVRQKDGSKFKIGYTINPRSRAKNYQTHSIDVEYIGHIEVSDKKYEKLSHYELLKCNYKKCITQGKTEWFEGNFSFKDFIDLMGKVNVK